MAAAGIMQSICLPLLSVYQLSSNGTSQVRNLLLRSHVDWSLCQGLTLLPQLIEEEGFLG